MWQIFNKYPFQPTDTSATQLCAKFVGKLNAAKSNAELRAIVEESFASEINAAKERIAREHQLIASSTISENGKNSALNAEKTSQSLMDVLPLGIGYALVDSSPNNSLKNDDIQTFCMHQLETISILTAKVIADMTVFANDSIEVPLFDYLNGRAFVDFTLFSICRSFPMRDAIKLFEISSARWSRNNSILTLFLIATTVHLTNGPLRSTKSLRRWQGNWTHHIQV